MFNQEGEKLIVLLIISLIVIILLLFLIMTFFIHRKRLRKIQDSMIFAEINTLENERKRFATDLHDEIGPTLSSINMHLEMLETEDEETKEKMSHILNDTIEKVRNISHNITPKFIDSGLKNSIEYFIHQCKEMYPNIQFFFENNYLPLNTTSDFNLHIYRIAQEAINNAVKYAQPSQIKIVTRKIGNKFLFTIINNGIGFNAALILNSSTLDKGIGLKNIQNRVNFIGGELDIVSEIEKGTQIVVQIPIASFGK